MVLTIILIVVFVLALGVLGVLLWKKLPQLRIIDPVSSSEEQSKKLKNELIRQRIERGTAKQVDSLRRRLRPVGTGAQDAFRRLAGKLTAVERRYQEKQRKDAAGGMTPELAKEMIEEGREFLHKQLWDRAEKKFIDVISAMPRHAEAYEQLGRLYLAKKEYATAKETFAFLAKISENDPSVIASLGEVEKLLGNDASAYEHFKKAVELSPKNPRYLDFLVDAAITVGEKHEAMSMLDKLREANPENKKIEMFEKRISDM